MSIKLSRASLDKAQKERIRKDLTLIPESKQFVPKNIQMFQASKEPIYFYLVENDDVFLPFNYGVKFVDSFPNDNIKRTKHEFGFIGKLRPFQIEIVNEAIEHLNTSRTTTLSTFPGSGKTIMGAYLATNIWKDKQEMILIMHPRSILNESWKTTFQEFTNAKVWVVPDKQIDPIKDYRKTYPNSNAPDVIISVDQSLDKIPQKWLDNIGVLIIDEAHMLCTQSKVSSLLKVQPKYIIAETATLEREQDGMEVMIHHMCGEHSIYRSNKKSFTVFKLNTGIKPETVKTSRGIDWNHLVNGLCEDESRNKLIVSIAKFALTKGWKIMILTVRKSHIDTLLEMIRNETITIKSEEDEEGIFTISTRNITADSMMGNKKNYQDSDVLLASVSKAGVGFDEQMSCSTFGGVRSNFLIYCASSKKESVINQHIGRIMRSDEPIVVHLVDDNPSVKRHWNVAKKFYISMGAEIKEWSA